MVLNPTGATWANNATALGFVWYLGATPAAALVNTTQLFVVSLPVLSAHYGTKEATVELHAAFKGAVNTKSLKDNERAMLDKLIADGAIDTTMAHDLAGMGDTDTGKYREGLARAMGVVSAMFHYAEVFNRRATAIATYRLAVQKGKSHEEAVAEATKMVWETQFDYSNSNRARWMQNNGAKVLLLFRQYSVNMTYFIVKNLKEAVLKKDGFGNNLSAEDIRLARHKIIGLTLTTLGLGGLTAMPLYSVVALVMGMLGDADDSDDDVYKMVKDVVGAEGARLVMQGPTNWLTGVDMSSRTAVDLLKLWYRSPDKNLDAGDFSAELLKQIAGPVFAIPISIYQKTKWRLMAKSSGIEKLCPKFIKDPMQPFRFASGVL